MRRFPPASERFWQSVKIGDGCWECAGCRRLLTEEPADSMQCLITGGVDSYCQRCCEDAAEEDEEG